MSSANTFGTFLDTLKTLETKTPQRSSAIPDVFTIAKFLMASNGSASIKAVMNQLNVSGEALFDALVAGREKGLFEVDESSDDPALKLTKLGRSLAG